MNFEYVAVFFTVVCIFLAGRNNIHTWWTGIVACIAYGYVFYGAKLYADALLQVFFIGTSILGWVLWSKRTDQTERPITSTDQGVIALITALAVLVTIGYSELLKAYTDAAAPLFDSAVLICSIIGQILLMRRNIQTWPVWILVNIISVPLYYSRELYLSAALYAVFLVHAIYAWHKWYGIYKKQTV